MAKIANIIWDLEEGDSDYALPKTIEIPKEKEDDDYDELVDWVSDEYGYCIASCDIVDNDVTTEVAFKVSDATPHKALDSRSVNIETSADVLKARPYDDVCLPSR